MLGSSYDSQGELYERQPQIWGIISHMKLEFFLLVKKCNIFSKFLQFLELNGKPCETEALLTPLF